MRKPLSQKKLAVRELKLLIRLSRKAARQINRKLESLEYINRAKIAAQRRLIELCGKR